jgi:16S rRNA (guanine966-N2)-methyltransferase
MRVIAGEAKGRRLRTTPSTKVRPSTDRLKEALFATVGAEIQGKAVLDLFAGSGALGIEALSRGAAHVTFVDSYQEAASMIQSNLRATGLEDRGTLVRSTVERFLSSKATRPFDVVFMDPSYATGLPAGLLQTLLERGFVNEDSLVVVEMSSRAEKGVLPSGYRLVQERRYGDSTLLYLRVEI